MKSRSMIRQQGAVQVVGLAFLVALTLLGLAAMKDAVLQERMAGGSRDRSLAFQAAEAALRDARRDILSLQLVAGATVACAPGAAGCRPTSDRPWNTAGKTPFRSDCLNGQCYDNPFVGGYAFGAGPHLTMNMTAAPSVEYGTFTNAGNIAGVAADPRYLIEVFTRTNTSDTRYFYRVTARGVGANPNTAVILQEVFAP